MRTQWENIINLTHFWPFIFSYFGIFSFENLETLRNKDRVTPLTKTYSWIQLLGAVKNGCV